MAIRDVIVVTEVVSSSISELFSECIELECSDCDSCIDDPIQPYRFEPSGTSGESSDSDEEEELGQGYNKQLSQVSLSDKNIQVNIYIYIYILFC